MSFYEELLTLGQHLHDRERLALYEFFIKTKSKLYSLDAFELIESKSLKRNIANGDIFYSLSGDTVSYSARKKGTLAYQENVREVKLKGLSGFRVRKLIKFFAQTEVEIIWNYPLQGRNPQDEAGYCIIAYPYFDLRYFSNGGSRIVGLFNKLRINDSDLMKKLNA